jgi:hypothetical protein
VFEKILQFGEMAMAEWQFGEMGFGKMGINQ